MGVPNIISQCRSGAKPTKQNHPNLFQEDSRQQVDLNKLSPDKGWYLQSVNRLRLSGKLNSSGKPNTTFFLPTVSTVLQSMGKKGTSHIC